MRSIADQLETIGLMAAHESAIGDLYQAYAARFPHHAEFFHDLAADEREHARLIVGFAERVRTGSAHVNPDRFDARTILNSLDGVKQRLREAGDRSLSLVGALSVCADIEDSMLERRYFEIIEGDGQELRQLLESLAADTEAHRSKVRQAWEKERGATQ
jgi:rubrerythrin